jgi:hypothetical protein
VVDLHVSRGASRHGGRSCIGWVLDHGCATALLYCEQAGGTIVKISREDYTDYL